MNAPVPPTHDRELAESHRIAAESARTEAEHFRRLAEEAREVRDQHREALESVRQDRERLREAGEMARAAGEEARAAGEEAALRDRLLQPLVVPARSHAEHAAHRPHVVLLVMGLNEFIGRTDSPAPCSVDIGIALRDYADAKTTVH